MDRRAVDRNEAITDVHTGLGGHAALDDPYRRGARSIGELSLAGDGHSEQQPREKDVRRDAGEDDDQSVRAGPAAERAGLGGGGDVLEVAHPDDADVTAGGQR